MEVEGRVPVVGVVTLDESSTAVGLDEVGTGGGEAEVAATQDVVDVSRGNTGVDNGISTSGDQALVGESQNSESSAVLGGGGNASHGGNGRGGGGELHIERSVTLGKRNCIKIEEMLSTSYARVARTIENSCSGDT